MQVIVGCLVEDDGKILVVSEASEKNYGKWNYPVGHLEVGESICEGAIRETYEETGYNVELSGVLPIQEVNKNGEKYVLIIFLAKIISFDEEHKLDGILEKVWKTPSEILEIRKDDFRVYNSNIKMIEYYTEGMIYPLELIGDLSYE